MSDRGFDEAMAKVALARGKRPRRRPPVWLMIRLIGGLFIGAIFGIWILLGLL